MAATTCSIDGCERTVRARTWCIGHYNRWLKYGAPGEALLQRPTRERHHAWTGSDLSYGTAHDRVARERGRASEHTCVDCSGPAASWAYDHSDPQQKVDERGRAYSGDTSRYEPKCFPCHKRADLARRAA